MKIIKNKRYFCYQHYSGYYIHESGYEITDDYVVVRRKSQNAERGKIYLQAGSAKRNFDQADLAGCLASWKLKEAQSASVSTVSTATSIAGLRQVAFTLQLDNYTAFVRRSSNGYVGLCLIVQVQSCGALLNDDYSTTDVMTIISFNYIIITSCFGPHLSYILKIALLAGCIVIFYFND